MIGGMTDEPVAREVWKQARNIATGDKAAVVQASALQVRMIRNNDVCKRSPDADSGANSALRNCYKPPHSSVAIRSLKSSSLRL